MSVPAHTLRKAERVVLAVRRRVEPEVSIGGLAFEAPAPVFHPALDGSTAFFARIAGPMIAPGHRVLDVGTGCGVLGALAAHRGASVVACDVSIDAIRAAESNLRRHGLSDRVELRAGAARDVVPEGGFDLVFWNGPQDTRPCLGERCFATKAGAHHGRLVEVFTGAPRWIGESGRMLVLADAVWGADASLLGAVPEGFRLVPLRRSAFGRFTLWSLGWDAARARAERQEGASERRARVSRRRWQQGEVDAGEAT